MKLRISRRYRYLRLWDAEGNWLTISLAFPGREVYARIWKVNVGRVELYLLDTDFEDNQEGDRSITHYLYGGDWENRLKQEILLGIGGIRALRKLNIRRMCTIVMRDMPRLLGWKDCGNTCQKVTLICRGDVSRSGVFAFHHAYAGSGRA